MIIKGKLRAQLVDMKLKQTLGSLKDCFGISVSGVDISVIEIDISSDDYRQLIAAIEDVAIAKIQLKTDDYTGGLRIQREEGQYAQH